MSQFFSRKGSLAYHMISYTRNNPYQCSECNMSFKQLSTLTIHMITHTGENQKQYSPYDKDLMSKNYLEMHKSHDNHVLNEEQMNDDIKYSNTLSYLTFQLKEEKLVFKTCETDD